MEEKHVPVLRQRSYHRRLFVLRFHRDDTQLPNTGLVGRSSGVEGIRILVELRAKSFAGGGDSINGRGLLQSRHMVERYGFSL